jgi:hypothetical protein
MPTFKKLEGHTSLISALAVSALQLQLAKEIIKLNGGAIISRKNLKAAHLQLRNKKASPYFIAKNVALKVKSTPGAYDLSRLKLAKGEIENAIESNVTPPPTSDAPVIVKSAKRERTAKKEKLTLTSRAKSRSTRKSAAPAVDANDATAEPPSLETVNADTNVPPTIE